MRKIIQIAARSDGPDYGPLLYALCDDGSVWFKIPGKDSAWESFPPIPQDEAKFGAAQTERPDPPL